ncbi:hypothetical protein SBA_ch2_5530 [Sphingomonas bisphenolicum]|uniref:Uncharacterized protein n=1 Tax=Sphingomonas bisphenolicum TaxID=296544 RepID=A0ABM7GAA0_9SPHN|nr:hypothetical protein SBA_ch2_5530 [Sphingomonas bisphenolicum]
MGLEGNHAGRGEGHDIAACDQITEQGVGCSIDHYVMKARVQCAKGFFQSIAEVSGLKQVITLFQKRGQGLRYKGSTPCYDDGAGRKALQHRAKLEGLKAFLTGEAAHAIASPASRDKKTFLCQSWQSLTDGRA